MPQSGIILTPRLNWMPGLLRGQTFSSSFSSREEATFEAEWSGVTTMKATNPHLGLIRANCLARSCGGRPARPGPGEKPSLTNINTKREAVYLKYNSPDRLPFVTSNHISSGPPCACTYIQNRLHVELCGADMWHHHIEQTRLYHRESALLDLINSRRI